MQPEYGWPFFATLPVAALAAAGFAGIAGWPALRLRGAYFAIATWAMAEAVREFSTVSDFTGGTSGLTLPVNSSSAFFYYELRERNRADGAATLEGSYNLTPTLTARFDGSFAHSHTETPMTTAIPAADRIVVLVARRAIVLPSCQALE